MVVKTRCHICGKEIYIQVPKTSTEYNHYSFSCNDCVPVGSTVRNGIEESIYTELPLAYKIRKRKELRDINCRVEKPIVSPVHLEFDDNGKMKPLVIQGLGKSRLYKKIGAIKVKQIFKFETDEDWVPGEDACWTDCPFAFMIKLGNCCICLDGEIKCPFLSNTMKVE